MKALNIFKHNQRKYSPVLFMDKLGGKVAEYENIIVYKRFNQAYDFVVDGVIISQRCGHSVELLKDMHCNMKTNIEYLLAEAKKVKSRLNKSDSIAEAMCNNLRAKTREMI